MNIIALSDVHLRSTNPIARKDNFVRAQFNKLRFVFDYAKENNCIILQAGDFLDKSRDWNLLIKLMKFFAKYPTVQMHCVLGQHDSYFYSSTKATTLGVLEHFSIINILNAYHPYQTNGWNIWGSSWGEPLPALSQKELLKLKNILVTHQSISETQIYPDHKYTQPLKFLKERKEYQLVIVGDIHRSFFNRYFGKAFYPGRSISSNDRFIVNTGPMLRIEANQYNLHKHKPHFYHFVFNENNLLEEYKKIEIPHRSAAKVLSQDHLPENKTDVDIESLSNMLIGATHTTDNRIINKIIYEGMFEDKVINSRIQKRLMQIYEQAKGE